MNEHGFYHPSRGYWQTTGDVPADIFATYPSGTVEVPLKPGRWFEWINNAWQAIPPDTNELASTARARRDRLISESDFSQLPDVQNLLSHTQKQQWAEYRQNLRDITNQTEFPLNIVWPNRPDGK